jgi:hypothetical protein
VQGGHGRAGGAKNSSARRAQAPDSGARLSPREEELLQLLAKGLTIAAASRERAGRPWRYRGAETTAVRRGRAFVTDFTPRDPFGGLQCDDLAAMFKLLRYFSLTATQRIRALESELGRPRTPIVALSASAMADERERCLEAGMDDFLAKPFRAEELQARVARWRRPEPADQPA